jgi:hypothetical protein
MLVTDHDGRLLARIEDDHMVFEVSFDELEATDVTLRFLRDGEKVGGIYNDDGTERTMARLTVPGDTDFIGVEVPKAFVERIVDTALETGRVADETGYRGVPIASAVSHGQRRSRSSTCERPRTGH